MDTHPNDSTCGLCTAVQMREIEEEKARRLLPVMYSVVAFAWVIPLILALAFSEPKWLLAWVVSVFLTLGIWLVHLDRVESADVF